MDHQHLSPAGGGLTWVSGAMELGGGGGGGGGVGGAGRGGGGGKGGRNQSLLFERGSIEN